MVAPFIPNNYEVNAMMMLMKSQKNAPYLAPAEIEKDELVDVVFHINGNYKPARVKAHWTLLYVLRDIFGLTGTKEACGEGACGACTVLVDGVAVLSCMMFAVEQVGRKIETIESLKKDDVLHPLQNGWLQEYGAQCGFCSPGMIMSAKGFLNSHPEADVDEIKEAMGGNICICGNYEHILNSILAGQAEMLLQEEQNDE